jgi:hypothetical protein
VSSVTTCRMLWFEKFLKQRHCPHHQLSPGLNIRTMMQRCSQSQSSPYTMTEMHEIIHLSGSDSNVIGLVTR